MSHSLDEILNLADTVVLLEAGKAVAEGAPEDLRSGFYLQRQAATLGDGVVIGTVVDHHDPVGGLTNLRFAGGMLKVPLFEVPVGNRVRVRIRPQDVAIALTRPEKISVQNIFPATIEEIADIGNSLVDVKLNIGRPLYSRVTPAAKADLGLAPGRQVYALVKSVAISRGGLNGSEGGV